MKLNKLLKHYNFRYVDTRFNEKDHRYKGAELVRIEQYMSRNFLEIGPSDWNHKEIPSWEHSLHPRLLDSEVVTMSVDDGLDLLVITVMYDFETGEQIEED